jgi:hypothetical protein
VFAGAAAEEHADAEAFFVSGQGYESRSFLAARLQLDAAAASLSYRAECGRCGVVVRERQWRRGHYSRQLIDDNNLPRDSCPAKNSWE